jgi:Uma2 family endonuclease
MAYNCSTDIWEEKLDGVIVAMAPRPEIRHHRADNRITRIFERHMEGKSCEVFGDGVDVFLTEKDNVVPDAMIVCNKEYWIVDVNNRSIEVYLLTEGKYEMHNLYITHPDWWLDAMKEEDKAALVYEFRTHLCDDMIIDIREVFQDVKS